MKILTVLVGAGLISSVACKKDTPPATETRAGEQRRGPALDAPRVTEAPAVMPPSDGTKGPDGLPLRAMPPIEQDTVVATPEPDLAAANDLSSPEGLAHAVWRAYKKKDVDVFKALVVTESDIGKLLLPEKSEVPRKEVAKLPDKFKKVLEMLQDVKWKGLKIGKPTKLGPDKGFKGEAEGIRKSVIYVERDGKPDRMRIRAMLKCDGKWKIASL